MSNNIKNLPKIPSWTLIKSAKYCGSYREYDDLSPNSTVSCYREDDGNRAKLTFTSLILYCWGNRHDSSITGLVAPKTTLTIATGWDGAKAYLNTSGTLYIVRGGDGSVSSLDISSEEYVYDRK